MKRTIIMSLAALPLLLLAGSNDLSDEGVGTYTDASVANQISNFTINRQMVSCGVGTVGASGFTGPFAMLMYAKDIQSYSADHATGTIRVTGRMRSTCALARRLVPHADLAVQTSRSVHSVFCAAR